MYGKSEQSAYRMGEKSLIATYHYYLQYYTYIGVCVCVYLYTIEYMSYLRTLSIAVVN